jgi:hypothetical protein
MDGVAGEWRNVRYMTTAELLSEGSLYDISNCAQNEHQHLVCRYSAQAHLHGVPARIISVMACVFLWVHVYTCVHAHVTVRSLLCACGVRRELSSDQVTQTRKRV